MSGPKGLRKGAKEALVGRFMPAAFVQVVNQHEKAVRVVALFDDGSDVTLISSRKAQELGLDTGQATSLTYQVVGGHMTSMVRPTTFTVQINDGSRVWLEALVIEALDDYT